MSRGPQAYILLGELRGRARAEAVRRREGSRSFRTEASFCDWKRFLQGIVASHSEDGRGTGAERLADGTVFSCDVGYAGDEPLSVSADEVEEIGPAVIDFAVDEEFEGSPNYGEVVVDADKGVVDALDVVGSTGAADAFGKGVEGHLNGFAITHEDYGPAGQEGELESGGVVVSHGVEHRPDGGEDGLLCGSWAGGCGPE